MNSGPSDGALWERFRGGDMESLKPLWNRHYLDLYHYALGLLYDLGLLKDPSLAEDAVSEGFKRVMAKAGHPSLPEGAVKAYLRGFVRNVCHEILRGRRKAGGPLEDRPGTGKSPDEELEDRERATRRAGRPERLMKILKDVIGEIRTALLGRPKGKFHSQDLRELIHSYFIDFRLHHRYGSYEEWQKEVLHRCLSEKGRPMEKGTFEYLIDRVRKELIRRLPPDDFRTILDMLRPNPN